jgi:DNA polymerase I-like protein with 3'-5' exonuclease and polymerase domains
MNEIQLACKLDQIVQSGPNIFIKLNPEIVDFTLISPSFNLVFLTKDSEFTIEINDENFMEVLSLVKTALFENQSLLIIGWNLKNLFTYILSKTNDNLNFESKLLDLKLAEGFIGIKERAPSKFLDVVKRLKIIFADSSWTKFKSIYQKIYQPLMMTVIPKIEIEGVFDKEKRQILFPYYEIEGQKGGRLACQLAYQNCFNPHSLSEEEKLNLQPKGNDLSFLYFDYRFFEVCVLAWLSNDEALSGLLLEEDDFYKKLYLKLTGNECDTDAKRSFCKDYLFLPIIYGQSAKTLSDRAKIDIVVADKLIGRVQRMFPKLFDWVENYKIENSVCVDYIGRKRQLTIGEEYKYRNFIVQSPGAIFCLDKLVSLSDSLGHYGGVVASIHDGYVVRCDEKQTEIVKSICLKILETESDLFPGLKL